MTTKRCTTFEHTADVGLEARAGSLAELYEALAEGLAAFVCPAASGAAGVETRRIAVSSTDHEALAVDFLWEVMQLVQHGGFVLREARVRELEVAGGGARLVAELAGEPFEPTRHELASEVKAVTYHGLSLAEEPGGEWLGRVVLDL